MEIMDRLCKTKDPYWAVISEDTRVMFVCIGCLCLRSNTKVGRLKSPDCTEFWQAESPPAFTARCWQSHRKLRRSWLLEIFSNYFFNENWKTERKKINEFRSTNSHQHSIAKAPSPSACLPSKTCVPGGSPAPFYRMPVFNAVGVFVLILGLTISFNLHKEDDIKLLSIYPLDQCGLWGWTSAPVHRYSETDCLTIHFQCGISTCCFWSYQWEKCVQKRAKKPTLSEHKFFTSLLRWWVTSAKLFSLHVISCNDGRDHWKSRTPNCMGKGTRKWKRQMEKGSKVREQEAKWPLFAQNSSLSLVDQIGCVLRRC